METSSVLEDGGTIHVYVSPANSAALANHTDSTDIFVLQLKGEKEWMFCQESQEDKVSSFLHNRLGKGGRYDEDELSNLVCHGETLYPGDGLFLPMRVVNSARATRKRVSAHITMGFPATTTFNYDFLGFTQTRNMIV